MGETLSRVLRAREGPVPRPRPEPRPRPRRAGPRAFRSSTATRRARRSCGIPASSRPGRRSCCSRTRARPASTLSLCRRLAPSIFLLARTRYLAEIPELSALGADEVVAEEFETSLEISGRTLRRLGFPLPWVESETDEIRRTREDGFRRFRAPDVAAERLEQALGGTRIEFVSVGPDWRAIGRTLRELELRASAERSCSPPSATARPLVTPGAEFVLEAHDQLLLLGDRRRSRAAASRSCEESEETRSTIGNASGQAFADGLRGRGAGRLREWAVETNQASNCAGGRKTPRSRIAWKKRA